MMKSHIINKDLPVREALKKLDLLASDAILFVTDDNERLIGSLTDGDLRRGFIKGLGFEDSILQFVQPNPAFIREEENAVDKLEEYSKKNFKVVPILGYDGRIVDVFNFRTRSTIIPVDAVIMAGGEGKRLRPLTERTPKPLLKVGDKPIIEHNIDRLAKVGVKNIHLSINYLGEQLEEYFGCGCEKKLNIKYIKETEPMGTIGSIHLADKLEHEDILVMNSDLLTNIDFLDFYKTFKASDADMAVAATSYSVDVPYAVLETDGEQRVNSLKEKPRYTYFSNAGIYLFKKSVLDLIPKGDYYDITDLMDKILAMDRKLVTFPINGYWLDIGKHEDFKKAQEDIKHLKL
ncbi:nucleotidyltransferase family protein [Echinicola marina]|uniref:nucleotidyltransferase family protein n=1 Tax=Echinicola marina TaxID=2859768 RepID=UPI001CF635EF|nr:nucleotidyltransferase family protein [Echinicola marina]UCS93246.1 nucleotidyltransferase family protein [Echinicola marina]